jgi:hypothetical protein
LTRSGFDVVMNRFRWNTLLSWLLLSEIAIVARVNMLSVIHRMPVIHKSWRPFH